MFGSKVFATTVLLTTSTTAFNKKNQRSLRDLAAEC
jgi:hypothetical protein